MTGCVALISLALEIKLLQMSKSQYFPLPNIHKLLLPSGSGYLQPAYSTYLVTAASLQVAYSSSMNTYRVMNVKPFRGVGLNKLAINEQLGGGLEDHRSI